jgi:hypothetical protein
LGLHKSGSGNAGYVDSGAATRREMRTRHHRPTGRIFDFSSFSDAMLLPVGGIFFFLGNSALRFTRIIDTGQRADKGGMRRGYVDAASHHGGAPLSAPARAPASALATNRATRSPELRALREIAFSSGW